MYGGSCGGLEAVPAHDAQILNALGGGWGEDVGWTSASCDGGAPIELCVCVCDDRSEGKGGGGREERGKGE